MPNSLYMIREINRLTSHGFRLKYDPGFKWVLIENVSLPRNGLWQDANNRRVSHVSILADIHPDFPRYVGVAGSHYPYAIHAPKLYFNGKKLSDLNGCSHSAQGWHWLCFEHIAWKENYNLLTLVKIIESSLYERAKKT